MKTLQIITTGLVATSIVLLSGCGVSEEDIPYSYTVKLSSLHYVKDATMRANTKVAIYKNSGDYDFNESIEGYERVAVGGIYIVDDNNESNTSLTSDLCTNYLPGLDTDASRFTLKAPPKHDPFEYINMNPFTTLLIETNDTAEVLAQRYPVAASIDASFDFDSAAARQGFENSVEENNLTAEICEALQELQNL
jgi:hypothetical protein